MAKCAPTFNINNNNNNTGRRADSSRGGGQSCERPAVREVEEAAEEETTIGRVRLAFGARRRRRRASLKPLVSEHDRLEQQLGKRRLLRNRPTKQLNDTEKKRAPLFFGPAAHDFGALDAALGTGRVAQRRRASRLIPIIIIQLLIAYQSSNAARR